jgi:hypothetical protein
MVGIWIDDENARPGHGIFLRDDASVDTARPARKDDNGGNDHAIQ